MVSLAEIRVGKVRVSLNVWPQTRFCEIFPTRFNITGTLYHPSTSDQHVVVISNELASYS